MKDAWAGLTKEALNDIIRLCQRKNTETHSINDRIKEYFD
jgi:hypothetical protein